jgi:DNA-binding transcriptional ArsR family regulator
MTKLPWKHRLAAVASLGDENRRRLFDVVASAADAVGRDDAAQAVGLARSTASFHLDRLVKDGLLAVEFRKLGGREGPGSGRPAKLYRAAVDEVAASVPDRHYDFAAELLVSAIEDATSGGGSPREALRNRQRAGGVHRGGGCGRRRRSRRRRTVRGLPGGARLLPGGRRRRATGAAELPVPSPRLGARGRGLCHERGLLGRGLSAHGNRPGTDRSARHQRSQGAGRRAARAVLCPYPACMTGVPG